MVRKSGKLLTKSELSHSQYIDTTCAHHNDGKLFKIAQKNLNFISLTN